MKTLIEIKYPIGTKVRVNANVDHNNEIGTIVYQEMNSDNYLDNKIRFEDGREYFFTNLEIEAEKRLHFETVKAD